MLEITLTLRVVSDSYSLSDLENLIGRPTKGFSKGDLYSNGSKIRQKTYWSLQSSLKSNEKFDLHVDDLISFIEKNQEAFSVLRNKSEIDLFCMLFSGNGQGGLVFSSELAKKVSQYSLNVVFDIYAETD
jgi:hypothetical protein